MIVCKCNILTDKHIESAVRSLIVNDLYRISLCASQRRARQ